MSKLTVYLDIDGTILYDPGDETRREELDYQLICEGLEELLEFVLAHCNPLWLSYRARLGRTKALEDRLFPHLPACARRIPPAHWDAFKHEGIDIRRPFVWFDDDPEERDLTWLKRNHRLDCFVQMEPSSPYNPIQMLSEIKSRMDNC
jgi:hypothetical protein